MYNLSSNDSYARALVSTILSRLMSSSIERSLIPRLLIQLYPISQTVEILALKLSIISMSMLVKSMEALRELGYSIT